MAIDWRDVLGAIQRRGDTRPLADAIQSGDSVPLEMREVLATALRGLPRPSRAELLRRALVHYRRLRAKRLTVEAARAAIEHEFGLSEAESWAVALGKVRSQNPAQCRETRAGRRS